MVLQTFIDREKAKYVKYILKFVTSQKITLTGSFIFSTSCKEVVTEDIVMWRARFVI
jgi:hypothetical protein